MMETSDGRTDGHTPCALRDDPPLLVRLHRKFFGGFRKEKLKCSDPKPKWTNGRREGQSQLTQSLKTIWPSRPHQIPILYFSILQSRSCIVSDVRSVRALAKLKCHDTSHGRRQDAPFPVGSLRTRTDTYFTKKNPLLQILLWAVSLEAM